MTRLWTIQIGDADTDEVTIYADQPGYPPLSEGAARLAAADRVVFHNGIFFDHDAINRFFPGTIRRERLFDTLIAARLFQPDEREHSLEVWGERLGVSKGNYTGDFQTFDDELVRYARQDIVVGRALYRRVKAVEAWGEACQLEHDTAWVIKAQMLNGFRLDVDKAQALEATLRGEIAAMTTELRTVFPPIWKATETAPFVPKSDNKRMGYVAGCAVTKVALTEFNPGSRIQVGDRLKRLGWAPQNFGADGHPTVDEATLASLPWPEAQKLVKYFETQKLLGQLADGKNAWLKLVKPDGRVYGRVITNGAVTGRMSHAEPNLAQVSSDHRARELWIPRDGWLLVGCDAEGLEARVLSHFLARYDGGAFTRMLLTGKKELGTDIHSSNMKAVQKAGYMVNRDGGKTLLYALIYGAQNPKLGRTVIDNLREQGLKVPRETPERIGRRVRAALATSMVGIDRLMEDIEKARSTRGYLIGLDGRHLPVRAKHAALNTLCQGAGAVLMKKALVMFDAARPSDWEFGYCANVHDEVEIECPPVLAGTIGASFADYIRLAGEHFNLRCPLAGDFKVGKSWAEVH